MSDLLSVPELHVPVFAVDSCKVCVPVVLRSVIGSVHVRFGWPGAWVKRGCNPTHALSAAPPDPLDETAAGTLEEDPDLYLWLASAEAQPLAME